MAPGTSLIPKGLLHNSVINDLSKPDDTKRPEALLRSQYHSLFEIPSESFVSLIDVSAGAEMGVLPTHPCLACLSHARSLFQSGFNFTSNLEA